MKAVIIAGAAVVAVLLGFFTITLFRLLLASVPYETWVKNEREKKQRKKDREQRRERRKRGKA